MRLHNLSLLVGAVHVLSCHESLSQEKEEPRVGQRATIEASNAPRAEAGARSNTETTHHPMGTNGGARTTFGRIPVSQKVSFTVSRGSKTQTLKIKRVADDEVEFSIGVSGQCSRTMRGRAHRLGVDPEWYDDKDGVGREFEQFVFERPDCEIDINVSLYDSGQHAFVEEGGCNAGECPFLSDWMQRVRRPK